MTPEQRRRSEQIFLDAVELPAQQRHGFVRAQCDDDTQVRNEVESLLAHENGAPFLDSGAIGVRASDVLDSINSGDDAPPQQVAGYRILRQIGRGGTASVYEAEQAVPRRIVAIKIVHAGPGTHGLRRRFEREIEVLGQLRHPGIAQIYDAGMAAGPSSPFPFFAMELVRGPNLTEFAAGRKLSERERLALLAEICDAVHYAHESGIIHRDLKPANILVDETTATPHPKVLDFGVARVLEGQTQLTVEHTHMAQIIGTIPYMSPEQVRGRTVDLDARTDVYSLGVILYELLGGRLPLDVRERSIAEAARVIQEEEPTRLSAINAVFRGDVETLVAKAIEKDRTRRYSSASDLAADIRRYLRDEPIRARPASTFYQLRKFAQRNRTLVASLALLMVGLAGAAIISTRAAISEAQQRRLAEQRAHRADIVAANAETLAGDPARARTFLDQASAADRDTWEWRYLAGRLETADRVLRGHTDAVNSVAFSPDGDRLVSASNDGTLRIWDTSSGVELMALYGHEGPVTRVAFDPGSPRIVSGGRDGSLRIWDGDTGQMLGILGCDGSVVDFGLSPDGSRLVALVNPRRIIGLESSEPKQIEVWNLKTQKLESRTGAPRALSTASCRFSGDGAEVWLGAGTGILRRDARTGRKIEYHPGGHDFPPQQIALDECQLATCATDKSIALWNPATFEPLGSLEGHLGKVRCVAFSAEGDRLVSGADDQTVRLWDPRSLRMTHTLLGCNGPVRSVSVSADGRRLAAASADETIALWDLQRLDSGQTDGVLRGHSGAVYEVACLPGRNAFVSASFNDKTLRIWDATSGAPLRVIHGMPGQMQRIVCSRDGRYVAVGSFGASIIDVETGEIRNIGHIGDRVRSIVFSPDERQLISTARLHRRTGLVQTWDLATATQVKSQEFDSDVLAVECPAGIRIAVMKGDTAKMIDHASGRELFTFDAGHGQIERLRYSPDGARFLTACADGAVGVFEGDSGRQIALLRGHTEKAYDALFSPDGSRIATASNDNTIRLWRADSFEEVLDLRGHERFVYCLAFTSDGSTLASASGDGTVRLWRAAPAQRRLR